MPDPAPPSLALQPPSGPGRDSRGASAGRLVQPQPAACWSLADVQVRGASGFQSVAVARAEHLYAFSVGSQSTGTARLARTLPVCLSASAVRARLCRSLQRLIDFTAGRYRAGQKHGGERGARIIEGALIAPDAYGSPMAATLPKRASSSAAAPKAEPCARTPSACAQDGCSGCNRSRARYLPPSRQLDRPAPWGAVLCVVTWQVRATQRAQTAS